jgi:ADP-ribosylglycohydrolase
MTPDRAPRLERALLSLDGLSVGDAFGERFFEPPVRLGLIDRREPPPPWPWTDDSEMAQAIVEVLQRRGAIDRDDLAATFARRYRSNPWRGYGGTAHGILRDIGAGRPWREAASEAFGGTGSMGNGGAMRSGPLGAWFADDLDALVENARASAEVTHAHPEGQAGAIAVALAAAWAWNHRDDSSRRGEDLLAFVLERTPDGPTREGIARALSSFPLDFDPRTVAATLGNGSNVIAPDTVPFALWSAASCLDDYAEAIWRTIPALGDIDTNCAIVGGIVALSAGRESIPERWLALREKLAL